MDPWLFLASLRISLFRFWLWGQENSKNENIAFCGFSKISWNLWWINCSNLVQLLCLALRIHLIELMILVAPIIQKKKMKRWMLIYVYLIYDTSFSFHIVWALQTKRSISHWAHSVAMPTRRFYLNAVWKTASINDFQTV